MVDVTAGAASEILFLRAGQVLTPCARGCGAHTRLLQNLLAISVQKKPAPVPEDLPHRPQDHPGTAADLSLGSGRPQRQPELYYPL